jgi:hypothetical protein
MTTIANENYAILLDGLENCFKAKLSDVRKFEQFLKTSKINGLFFREVEERSEPTPPPMRPEFSDTRSTDGASKKSRSFTEDLACSDDDDLSSGSTATAPKKRPDNFAPYKRFLAEQRENIAISVSRDFPALSGKERENKIKELAKAQYRVLSKEEKDRYK